MTLTWRVLVGDVRERLAELPAQSVQCCVTSPPYWRLRDYGTATWEGGEATCDHVEMAIGMSDKNTLGPCGTLPTSNAANVGKVRQYAMNCRKCGARRMDSQLGLEPTPDAYVAALVAVFREVRRVLRDDGVLWLNLGDSYAGSWKNQGRKDERGTQRPINGPMLQRFDGHPAPASNAGVVPPGLKPKDLVGIPWRVAFALQADGWYLRSDIIWCLSGGARVYARTQKGDMPVSVKDLVRLDPATVKLWNGQEWTQALGWSRSPDPRDGALEVELRSGECVGCTAGHEWPTQRGNVRTDALVAGDVIQTTTLPEPAAPWNAGALDEDVAWFCGLYLAEGSMSGETVQIAGHTNQSESRLIRLERMARRFHGTARVHTNGNTASISMDGPLIAAIVRAYIHGDSAKTKGVKVRAWQRDNAFLLQLLMGYLAGDGHEDHGNDRWRLGFTRNDRLAADLRTLAARVGASLRIAKATVTGFGREWPAYRGDLRLSPSTHHNAREQGEVVAVRPGKGRAFWDIGVMDAPNIFALASGVLTHNSKPNPMPESVTDRPTKSHEYVFLLSKSARYYYDADAIREPQQTLGERHEGKSGYREGHPSKGGITKRSLHPIGRNARSVWTIATQPYPEAHFAVYPEALPERCIKAGSRVGDLVLDPFTGSGTTGQVAIQLGRSFVGVELNPAYAGLARARIGGAAPLFAEDVA